MQAGEMIGFIEPVNVLNERYDDNRRDRERAETRFIELCLDLLNEFPDNVSEYEPLEELGLVTIEESPLCIEARDGSSLHVLSFGKRNKDDYLSFGIVVVEYNAANEIIDGHIYTADDNKFIRTPIRYDSGEDTSDRKTGRFSVIAMYREIDELDLLRIISSEKAQEAVNRAYEGLQPNATTELWEEALSRVPKEEEIFALAGLFVLAKPYSTAA